MRVALSCMALALVVHNFMTTNDHEWRYGHGDTLHGICISFSRLHMHLRTDGCLHCMASTQHQAFMIEGTKVTYARMAHALSV